jgi:mannose-1-phosphate guanylyltransferase/mannose-6-phosphate isomerase
MPSKKFCHKNLYGLILAGGTGSRFWPFSRELEPKQFMRLAGKESLLQNTLRRLEGVVRTANIYIITNKNYLYEVKKELYNLHLPEANIILEPEGKNTAVAIGVFARLVLQKNRDALFITLPSDHYIKDLVGFRHNLATAIEAAQEGYLVTIGIRPTKPTTAYGYVKAKAQAKKRYLLVERFFEKPNLRQARSYLKKKVYFWNSGIFAWKAEVFWEELKRCQPVLANFLSAIRSLEDLTKIWHKLKPLSVDYGILEHSHRLALVPADFTWADLGSWDALQEILPKDKERNIIQADALNYDSHGLAVFSRAKRLICTLGLKDLIIADTPDALLVCDKKAAQGVKLLVDKLKFSRRKEQLVHLTEKRPWGSYTILEQAQGFKIKLVEIEPGRRLSLQSHARRAEHWVVVSGSARITCDGTKKTVFTNQSIFIPKGARHRLENPNTSPLKIVEVQTGDYLEEDDIRRYNDDFKR